MTDISLFCKSFRGDIDRAALLVKSIHSHNRENLPIFFSVPAQDRMLFQNKIGTENIVWLTDEEIIASNPAIPFEKYEKLPGQISQQIVKSEFWRLNPQNNYFCVDSDSRFIRDFFSSDFLSHEGHPLTVMHQDKYFSQFCLTHNLGSARQTFMEFQARFREYFGRQGPDYSFGPFPVIWNTKVWRDLESQILAPHQITILDAIVALPSEAFWYGEALLKIRSIPIIPCAPFFKAYLYFEEYEQDARNGINENLLAQDYLGVVYQSNWYPKRLRMANKIAYKLKSTLRKIR